MRILIVTCLLSYLAANMNDKPMDCSHPVYMIDDKTVSKNKFEKLLQTLTTIPGTWFCAEMNDGGKTVFEGKDKKGRIYRYEAETSTLKCVYKLTRK